MHALEGVKVICVGQFYFAPYCTMLMARMGADVVKVESPAGDPYRQFEARGDSVSSSVQFDFVNAGKRSISLDLSSEAGQKVLSGLLEGADVLVQNLSPGAMERFGFGYDDIHEINPRLIMASGTGFGSFGPYAGEPAMDLTVQARSAVMSTTGFEGGPPTRTGPSVVDFMAGTHLLAGVLAALYQRSHTGEGQHVEVALQDAIIPSLTSNIAGYIRTGGAIPERTGNRHGGMAVAPYNSYETRDGWITILCPTNSHWTRLCDLIDDPATNDTGLAHMPGRCERVDEVDRIVNQWTSTKSKAELEKTLSAAKIPNAPVVTLGELLLDEHVKERGIISVVEDEQGTFTTLGSPIFLSESPGVTPTRAAGLGEHTAAVLSSELGLSEDDIARLTDDGIIKQRSS